MSPPQQEISQQDYLNLFDMKSNVGQKLTLKSFISLYNILSAIVQYVKRHGF